MATLGIDTSSKTIHMVLLGDNEEVLQQIKCGSKKKLAEDRFYEIVDEFYHQLSIIPIDTAGIESAIYIQNAKATIAIASVAATCKYALYRSGIPFSAVDNNTWKKTVIGKGNAKKPDIMEFAENKWGKIFPEQDFADAACIALWAKETELDDNAQKTE